jgi:hypothetical protein
MTSIVTFRGVRYRLSPGPKCYEGVATEPGVMGYSRNIPRLKPFDGRTQRKIFRLTVRV